MRMRWVSLQWTKEQFCQSVYHFSGGPNMCVTTRSFIPLSDDQVLVWGKTAGGWQAVLTSPVGLPIVPSSTAIASYIGECVPLCYQTYRNELLDILWQLRGSGLVAMALRLWTANYLLMRGWETLDGCTVSDTCSPYYGKRPAPRVMQNQLDAIIEGYMATCETALLAKLEDSFKRAEQWPEVYATLMILMLILEKDIWRLMFWTRHPEEVCPNLDAVELSNLF